jgi:hypothetical protein
MNTFSSLNGLVKGHEGSVGLSVCKVHISATRWRLFTLTAVALRFCRATAVKMKKRHLVAEINVGQQQRAYMIYPENVQLWKLFLAKGDTSDTFEVW